MLFYVSTVDPVWGMKESRSLEYNQMTFNTSSSSAFKLQQCLCEEVDIVVLVKYF